MTLREIFNAILDYPIDLSFDIWAFASGVAIAIVLIILVSFLFWHYDGDNGWYI